MLNEDSKQPRSEQHAGGGDIWTVASADTAVIAVLAVIAMAVDRVRSLQKS